MFLSVFLDASKTGKHPSGYTTHKVSALGVCDDVRHSLSSFLSEHRLLSSRPALTWPWPCRLLTSASQTLSGARQGSPSCFVEQRTLLFFGKPESREREDIPGGDYQGDFIE